MQSMLKTFPIEVDIGVTHLQKSYKRKTGKPSLYRMWKNLFCAMPLKQTFAYPQVFYTLCCLCHRPPFYLFFFSKYKIYIYFFSDERPIGCSQCPRRFRDENQLKTHMLVHTLEQNYVCKVVVDGGQICGRKFRYSSSLNIHRKKHSNILRKKFQCSSCPAKFVTIGKLAVHTRIHTGERREQSLRFDTLFSHKNNKNL